MIFNEYERRILREEQDTLIGSSLLFHLKWMKFKRELHGHFKPFAFPVLATTGKILKIKDKLFGKTVK